MIHATNIFKRYSQGGKASRTVLNGVSLHVSEGTFCAVLGPSGSGKSTLLKCVSGLETLDGGKSQVAGKDVSALSQRQMARFRRKDISFVFQEYNLIPDLTLEENITLDQRMRRQVKDLAESWKIDHVLGSFPAQCSGGQQQKAAILRALNKGSQVLFCDEPTGALDASSTQSVMAELQELVRTYGTTIMMITHNDLVTQMADQVIRLHDGQVVSDIRNPLPVLAQEIDW